MSRSSNMSSMDHWVSTDRMAYISSIREKKSSREIERCRRKLKGKDKNDPSDALKFAILYNHTKYCEFVLKKFGIKALSDKHVCCPLIMLAVRLDYSEIVRLICKYGQKIDFTKFDHPFSPERRYYVDAPGCLAMEYKRTSLHIAILMGHHKSAEALIDYGSDVNRKDSNGLASVELFASKFPIQKDLGNADTVREKKLTKLRCGASLLKMRKTVPYDVWKQLVDIYSEYDQLSLIQSFMPHGIPSLMHLSRVSIRDAMGPGRVPGAIDELVDLIPHMLIEYLKFEE